MGTLWASSRPASHAFARIVARFKELALPFIIQLAVLLLNSVHFSLSLRTLRLKLKDRVILVLIQSLEPLKLLILLLHLALKLVLLQPIFLQL